MSSSLRLPSPVSIATALALLAVVLPGVAGCPTVTPPDPADVDRRTFTARFTDEIVLPRLARFATTATSLRETTGALGASNGGVAERSAAQQAWRDAMAVWQELEVLHLGPAGSPASFVGGQGLRDRIYAWPQLNLCALDAQMLANEFAEPGWADTRLPNVLGLAPLEYVLFVATDANACPDTAAINTDGSWAALGAAELGARRARMAAVLAVDVELRAAALDAAWRADAGFAESLRTAGEKGSAFATAQQALDEIYAGLFAIELMTKDKKLGIPSGLHVDCPTTSCPDKAESRFARTSKENVLANLEATRRVFLGLDRADVDGAGFDDLLRDRGADDVATTMTQNLDAAIAVTRAFSGTFEDALVAEPARVQAVYEAVKLFTDDLKSTLPSTLGLRVPDEGAGDND